MRAEHKNLVGFKEFGGKDALRDDGVTLMVGVDTACTSTKPTRLAHPSGIIAHSNTASFKAGLRIGSRRAV